MPCIKCKPCGRSVPYGCCPFDIIFSLQANTKGGDHNQLQGQVLSSQVAVSITSGVLTSSGVLKSNIYQQILANSNNQSVVTQCTCVNYHSSGKLLVQFTDTDIAQEVHYWADNDYWYITT